MMKRRLALLPLSLILALNGCESLGPEAAKRTPIPPNLRIEPVHRALDSRPIQSEPLGAKPAQPPEFYPASGNLLGRGGATMGAAPEAAARAHKEGKYTLNFDDADLNEVAKTILDETLKQNYVISPKVSGRVTLQTTRALTDEELIPTLETLLRLNGAVMIKEGGVYRIEPEVSGVIGAGGARMGLPGQRIPTGYQLRVVPLRYVGAQEMQKVLEPLMPPKSIVRVDSVRNMLWLAGSSDELASVLDTIQLFDVDFMRGMSVGIFPLSNVEPALVGTEIEKILGDTAKGPLAGLVRIMPIERLNAIMAITPQPRYLEEISSWVGRLDRYSPNRMGSIHVYRLQNVDAIELAKTLSNIFGGGGSGSGSRASLRPGFQDSNVGASSSGVPGGGGSGFTDSSGNLGSSTSGSLGFGSASGDLGSTMGPTNLSSSGGLGGGSSGGLGGSSSGGLGGSSSGGFGGGSSGSGGFGGGIGRGTSGSRQQGSMATNLGNIRIVADPANNALIVTAKAQEYKEIEAIIKELDVLPLQVLIDATIAEVFLTDELKYGIKWYFQQGSNGQVLNPTNLLDTNVMQNAIAGAGNYSFTYSLMAAGKDVRLLLQAQADKGKVNMLSSPSVMVLNNQEASMRVGDQIPILTGQYGNPGLGGTSITGNPALTSFNSIQYRDTGVLLNVRPRVNAGGLVSMDIIQTVSNVRDQKSGEINSPTIAQRQIKSNVAVHDGETLVLGGLIKEDTGNSRSGIPLLYELPVLGDLFGKTDMAAKRTELVVLLTPRIVDNQVKAREISNEFRRKLTGLYDPGPSNINIGTPNYAP